MLGTGERGSKKVPDVVTSIAAVLAGGLLFHWLYVLYTASARRRIASFAPSGWQEKIGALSMRGLLDFIAVLVLVVSVLAFFFLFLDRTFGQGLLLAAYLTGLVVFLLARVTLRFFLALREPKLRIAPFDSENAIFLYYWLLALAFTTLFNLLGLSSGQAVLTLLMVPHLLFAGLDSALDSGGSLRIGRSAPGGNRTPGHANRKL